MLRPRWRKVIRDLWNTRSRTALVVLSIAVGVLAIGMIVGTQVMIQRSLTDSFLATNPASATLLSERIDDELVRVVRGMPGVGGAEARREITVRVNIGPDEWRNMQLVAIPNYQQMSISTITPVSGAWPPTTGEVLLERASPAFINAEVGSTLQIKTLSGKRYQLHVGGLAYDPSHPPPFFTFTAYGYVTLDTLERLGEPREFNQLNIVVAERPLDTEHIKAVAGEVQDKIERSERSVYGVTIPPPRQHPVHDAIQALLLLLGVLSVCALLLSGFLVVNTIGSVLTQQIRQIGVMKAIGARSVTITTMYLGMVLVFGVLALLIGIPGGAAGASMLSGYLGGLLNFDVVGAPITTQVLVLQGAAGIIVPLLAALIPIAIGSSITIREALSGYGLGRGSFGTSWFDHLIGTPWVARLFSRPLLLSLRNTFRRKGRLLLTLITLTLAGATFTGVLSVRASGQRTLVDVFSYYKTDVVVFTERPYRTQVLDGMRGVPGVADIEGWGNYSARRARLDGSESNNFLIQSLPAQSRVFNPTIIEGRWLLPEDENAIVINTTLLEEEPEIRVGDRIEVKVAGQTTRWHVVGIAQILLGERGAYVNQAYFGRLVGEVGRANYIHVLTTQHDQASQERAVKALERYFDQERLRANRILTVSGNQAAALAQFNIIIVLLLVMALLEAVVGGLGLMGMMSINVIERTREIGVLRAIGASNTAVLRIFMAEGILTGLLSAVTTLMVALPFSRLLSDAVGIAFLQVPFSYTFSLPGLLIWFAGVVVLAALASLWPAWTAIRLTVRDTLSYEQ